MTADLTSIESSDPPVLEHHTAAVGAVRLHYVTSGSGDPLVLLHGWPQTWASWRRVIGPLSDRYTVIAPDLRGFGSSAKPDSGYDTNTVSQDIRELVRSLGFKEIYLAGHDWGGATAYSYAAQFRDEVRKLSIFEMLLPGLGMMEGAMNPQPDGNFLWHMGFQSVPDIPHALIQGREEVYLRFFFDHFAYNPAAVSSDDLQLYARAMQQAGALRAGLEYYKSYFTSAAQNADHAKNPLTIPVSAWGGEACLGALPRECLELAATEVQGGVIDRCGHWVGEERPQFIVDHLLDFFAER